MIDGEGRGDADLEFDAELLARASWHRRIEEAARHKLAATDAGNRKLEWIAIASILFFLYFAVISPPGSAFTIIDAIVMLLLAGGALAFIYHETRIQRASLAAIQYIRHELEDASRRYESFKRSDPQ